MGIATAIILLTSCGSSRQAKQENKISSDPSLTNLQQKMQDGVDFFAKGNSPASWTLEISFNKSIRLIAIDGVNIVASSVIPVESAQDKKISLTTNTQYGPMQINIYKEACSNELSKENFSKKVVVEVNGKTYTGCGSFLYNKNIDGKWILNEIKQEKLNASNFSKGLPEINFDMDKGQMAGHNGCNNISGRAEAWGSILQFGTLISTEMACTGKKEINFGALLSEQMLSYTIMNNTLTIYLPDDGLAIFSKK